VKLMIIDGIPQDHPYASYSDQIVESVKANQDHQIDLFRLRDMTIHPCTGCWACWYKTPGYCAIKDDQEAILSRIPHVDRILYVTPVIAGYESSLIKTCKDRSIPTAHPYIKIHKGEQHHLERYDHSPDIAVLALTDPDTSQEDIDLIQHTYNRMALNFYNDETQVITSTTKDGGIDHVLNSL